jgi:hypothetical protein
MSKSHQESNTVYHYTRIIDKRYLLEDYYTIVEKIFKNEISSGMELLEYPGYKVYSARVNDKIRLIFGEQNNKLHVICVLTNHKYKRVLKGKWLKTYLKKEFNIKEADLPKDAVLKVEDFQPCKTPPVFRSTPGKIHFKAIDLCKSRTITYDETQESVIEADFPLTVSGVSGAGKTVTLIAKLTLAASRLNKGKLLVITSSTSLAEGTQKEYLRFAEANPNIQVDIKTMEEVIKQYAPETQKLPFVGEAHFQLWFTNVYLKNAGKLNIKPELLKNLALIYDECKLVVGLRTEDLDIGLRYRQFKTAEEINWLKQLSVKYTKCLESTKR